MPHDIDYSGAYFAHHDANLPERNFIAINPENGHGHCAILLASPLRVILLPGSSPCGSTARSSAASRVVLVLTATTSD